MLVALVASLAGAAAPPVSTPGEHVFLVATSAHSPGAAGSNWVTDLVLHNPADTPATVNVYFLERGRDNSGAAGVSLGLAANSSTRLADVVAVTFGRNPASGAILLGSSGALLVVSRTFNNAATGTYGQYVEGYPALDAVTGNEQVRLLQLARTTTYRTNIGVANATGSRLVVQVALYRADGSSLGTRTLSLLPYGYAQDDDTFAKVGTTSVPDGYAVVSSATAGARYFTYASVIDSRSNDPICVVPVGRTTAAAAAGPAVAARPGGSQPAADAAPAIASGGLAVAPATVTAYHLAGTSGGPGSTDGSGASARFAFPSGIVADTGGNAFIADTANHTIRRLSAAGAATTLAGLAGHPGWADGGSTARFSRPGGLAMDASGNLYVADTDNHVIRKVTPQGQVTTLAGAPGTPGSADGAGSKARFRSPAAVTVDLFGNLFVADTGNHTVRRVTLLGAVTTLAGKAGTAGSTDGYRDAARFSSPSGVAADGVGNVWVADTGNHTVRRVSSAGQVSTMAGLAGVPGWADAFGTAARFFGPAGLASDGQGGVWVTELGNCTLRRVSSAGQVSTVAGSPGQPGTADGTLSAALFTAPRAVAGTFFGYLLVADTGNHTIRKVTTSGVVSTLAGLAPAAGSADGAATSARFNGPADVAVDPSANVFVADQWNHTIRKISSSGSVSTLAGRAGQDGSTDGSGTSARFRMPSGLAVDTTGALLVTDRDNHTIRKVTASGSVTTLAGKAGQAGSSDGTGSAARFSSPDGLAAAGDGSVVVADTGSCTIRRISAAGAVSTLAGQAGSCGSTDGTGSAARFSHPSGVAVTADGTTFVADTDNHVIRKVSPAGVVTTLAGKAGEPGGADGAAEAARFTSPSGLALGPSGVLWVTEQQGTVRRVDPDGTVTTPAGLAGAFGCEDGSGSAARFNVPLGIAVAGSDALVVADYDNNAVRRLVVSGCELACAASATPAAGRAPLEVAFTGTAQPFGSGCGPATWTFSFGDSSGSGAGASVAHTYTSGGTFTWTATVSAGDATCSRTGTITVEPPCGPPAAPVLTAPSIAATEVAYALSWTATSPDGTYELQESTDAAFADATSRAVTGTGTTTTHTAGATTTWYSRVRATLACGGESFWSPWSAAAATSVVAGPPPGEPIYLPAAAHVPGYSGTVWVTDLEIHNPGPTPAGFAVELLKASQGNPTPQGAGFTLDPGTSLKLADVLWEGAAAFNHPGSATLRITQSAGSVMATQRTYNNQPSGTYGQFIPGLPASAAIGPGQQARLAGLSQSADLNTGFRTNLGLANASAREIAVVFSLYRSDGFLLGRQSRTLGAYAFIQIGNVFNLVSTQGVAEGFIVLETATDGGAFFAYASVVDNRSGDPIYVPARVVATQ